MSQPIVKLIVLRASDLERAGEFYRCLGIEFKREQHGSGPCHLAAELGDLAFEIYPAKNAAEVDRATRLGFSTEDLPLTLERVATVGGEIRQPARESPWGTCAVVRDPDGRSVELCQR